MGQQPNIEIAPSDLPRQGLPLRNPGRWLATKPGVIDDHGEMPRGKGFGRPGPDTGYALSLIRREYPDGMPPRAEAVFAALVGARAAHFGRAPTMADLDVVEGLMGLGENPDPEAVERRDRWVTAVAHEKFPGDLALSEIGEALFTTKSR